MKGLWTVGLLVVSNIFMTFAWYGQLRLKGQKWFDNLPLAGVILLCWSVALVEYSFQVPANRIGFHENGGPFSLVQLKVIQEVVSLLNQYAHYDQKNQIHFDYPHSMDYSHYEPLAQNYLLEKHSDCLL